MGSGDQQKFIDVQGLVEVEQQADIAEQWLHDFIIDHDCDLLIILVDPYVVFEVNTLNIIHLKGSFELCTDFWYALGAEFEVFL